MTAQLSRRSAVFVVFVLVAALVGPVLPVAAAASATVNSPLDVPDADAGDGLCDTGDMVGEQPECTLRAAVQEANASGTIDAITLPAGTYGLTRFGREEDAADTGDLDILENLTLHGAGPDVTVIDGDASDRLFDVAEGVRLAMSAATITNGEAGNIGGDQGGGGLLVREGASLFLDDVTVTGNSAGTGHACCGGGISNLGGDVELNDSRVEHNLARECCGGGIYNTGTLTLTRTSVSRNVLEGSLGGGLYNHRGTVTVVDSAVDHNEAVCCGGGIYSSRSSVDQRGGLTITGSSVSANTLTDCCGGGIQNIRTPMTITDSAVDGNAAADCCGGGISTSEAEVAARNVTIADNVVSPGDEDPFRLGAGLYAADEGSVNLTNVTVSGNVLTPPASEPDVAGIYVNDFGAAEARLTLSGGTVANNRMAGITVHGTPLVEVRGSVLTDNDGGDCRSLQGGAVTSLGHNLSGDGTCAFTAPGDLPATEAGLGPLGDHGGPTRTHLPAANSPLIDAGPAADDCPDTDQRGVPRPQDGDGDGAAACDIGAVEVGPGTPPPLPETAALTVEVLDPDGQPLGAVVVVRRVADDRLLASRRTRPNGTTSPMTELPVNEPLAVSADLQPVPDALIATHIEEVVTLTADETVVLQSTELDTGVVAGTVQRTGDHGPQPVSGARVTVTVPAGRVSTRQLHTTTDADGAYTLPVPAGPATVAFSWLGAAPLRRDDVTVVVDRTVTVDATLAAFRRPYRLHLDLHTRHFGSDPVGPLTLDSATLLAYGITVERSGLPVRVVGAETGRPIAWFEGFAGDHVTVCADGALFGLPAACTTVETTDSDVGLSARIDLEQAGLIRTGLRQADDRPHAGGARVTVWRVGDDGARQQVQVAAHHTTDPLDVGVAEAGRYEITASAGALHWSSQVVTVGEGAVVELPPLLPLTGQFTGATNQVTATRTAVPTGQTTDIRSVFTADGSVSAAVARLEVPAGTELLPAGTTLDGDAVSGDHVDGYVEVALGDLDAGDTRVLRHRLRVTKDAATDAFPLTARIRHSASSAEGDRVGAVQLHRESLTLFAPRSSRSANVAVSGAAPAGSTVVIYDSTTVVGEARTSAGGLWDTRVTLADHGDDTWHRLRAETEVSGQIRRSSEADVLIDSTAPEATNIRLRLFGQDRSFDPRQGVARFGMIAYAVDLVVDVEFTGADRVRGLIVHVGTLQARAARLDGGTFRAVLGIGHGVPGAIRLEYDVAPPADGLHRPPVPSPEQLEARLPPELAQLDDIDFAQTQEGMTETTTVTAALPELGPEATFSSEMSVTRGLEHQLTEADHRAADASGVPVYDLQVKSVLDDGEMAVEVSALIAESAIETGSDAEVAGLILAAMQARPAVGAADTVGSVRAAAHFEPVVKVLIAGFTDATNIDSVMSAWGSDDKYKKIDALYRLWECIDYPREAVTDAENRRRDIDRLIDQAKGLDVYNGIATVAQAASSVGGPVAAVGVWAVTWGIGKGIEWNLNENLELLKSVLLTRVQRYGSLCDRPDEGHLVADAVWGYDPSGYAYEAVESNRVPGVTATLLASDDPDGPWELWDADWWGQINPLITDDVGHYAWDVPEDFYYVAFDKDGYEPAESDVLEVLPPHFDVNVGLVSRAAPEVTNAAAYADPDSAVVVTFDRYMVPDEVLAGLEVTDDGEAVAGSVHAVDAEDDPDGRQLARTFEFVPGGSFADGQELVVTVPAAAETYAGVALGAPAVIELVATAKPPPPPPPNRAPVAREDTYVATIGEQLTIGAADGVLGNDTDADGDPLTASHALADGPDHGTLAVATDGSFVYTPTAGFGGLDGFTYTAADGRGGTAVGSVILIVADAPVETDTGQPPGSPGGGTPPANQPERCAPAPSTAACELAAGETVTVGAPTTAAAPLAVAVTTPQGGPVTVDLRRLASSGVDGFTMLGWQADIGAPAATADDPLRLAFRLHRSLLPDGHGQATPAVFRNGQAVPDCRSSRRAEADPCVASRTIDGTDVVVSVLTSRASTWTFAVPDNACPAGQVPVSRFADVAAAHTHAAAIDCLTWWRVTRGVGRGRYDPGATVTRGQMASFLANLLAAAGRPLAPGPDAFADDDGSIHEDSINALVAAGIVRGRASTTYAPAVPVSRGQLASLLVRSYEYVTGDAAREAADRFGDDDGNVHEAAINAAADAGLARGVTRTRFAPHVDVTRAQMASFLTRLLDRFVQRGFATPPDSEPDSFSA